MLHNYKFKKKKRKKKGIEGMKRNERKKVRRKKRGI